MGSHEISPDEDLITKERQKIGDLEVVKNGRGKISHAIPKNLTIIKELIRREVFPYHFEVYGVGFMEMRNAFYAPWAVRSSAVLMEQWGVGVSSSKATEIYQAICRIIGIRRMRVIQFLIEELKEQEVKQHHAIYKECFEKLIQAMDEERERIYAEQKIY